MRCTVYFLDEIAFTKDLPYKHKTTRRDKAFVAELYMYGFHGNTPPVCVINIYIIQDIASQCTELSIKSHHLLGECIRMVLM
jgi:hypothetical protein